MRGEGVLELSTLRILSWPFSNSVEYLMVDDIWYSKFFSNEPFFNYVYYTPWLFYYCWIIYNTTSPRGGGVVVLYDEIHKRCISQIYFIVIFLVDRSIPLFKYHVRHRFLWFHRILNEITLSHLLHLPW